MSRQSENTAFGCARCGAHVRPLVTGSYRNHCPTCLWSLHLDVRPGDRAAGCGGLMRPVGLDHRSGKGWMVVHVCRRCGHVQRTRAALDDPCQPDDPVALAQLSGGPLESSTRRGWSGDRGTWQV